MTLSKEGSDNALAIENKSVRASVDSRLRRDLFFSVMIYAWSVNVFLNNWQRIMNQATLEPVDWYCDERVSTFQSEKHVIRIRKCIRF